jgi:heparan-alpha-glucosaminide N-acetyltransferase
MTMQDSSSSTPLADLTKPQRLVSLDAYRGAIMLMMASAGLGAAHIARQYPDSSLWQFLAHNTEHAEWAGFTVWDVIQPAFMFMVGVALPFSVASRQARGHSRARMLVHALWRAVALILLAVFLSSAWSKQTSWSFANVLAQIGWGYFVVFLLAFTRPRTQWVAALGILFAYWLAFVLHPLPAADFDWQSVGVPADWSFLTGFAAHWEKNANIAAAFDQWFLNLFPRAEAFVFNRGGYATLNFVPSMATMIFGLLAGGLLRREGSIARKVTHLVLFGIAGVVVGKAIALAGLCPIVKRIWTPSWAICSAGVATLLLAGFVAVIEGLRLRRWAFPFVVVGLNPIALYCMWQLGGGFVRDNLQRHLGQDIFETCGADYTQTLQRGAILLVFWLVLLWMYRRKIFLRI